MPKKTHSASSDTSHELAFEEIEHTADWSLRIYGSNLRELLLNAARGMNSIMLAEHVRSATQATKSVELHAMDAESLLVEWLSELAFWAETEMLAFHNFDLQDVSPTHIKATLYGSRVTQLEKHIKAVTYHNLEIVQTAKGLTATVVFDV
ncbi:MAG: archease [Desulfobacterales bacterium]|nr:archease [Deltaproteobacteria bacterium]NNL76827.1 archease [Desulfobacterales bacterium]